MRILFMQILWCAALSAADRPALLLSRDEAEAIRSAISRGESWAAAPAKVLRAEAVQQLKRGPWTVVSERPKGMSIDVHEYYSEGPYWWPDPQNPTGPYIRRDGHTNPDRFLGNKRPLGEMADAVLALGAAAYFLENSEAGRRAVKVLTVWFLDPSTRMNPNLEYGQAVRGRNTGRGSGIIDSRPLIHVVQGIELLDLAGKLDPASREGLRRWFADYTTWLTTGKKGLDEKKSGNNHASWWAAQVAAYAAFTGDSATQKMAFHGFRDELFPKQIEPDGSAPREEARTKSLGYSTFNLEAYTVLCRIAEKQGVDLWHVRTSKGATLETVMSYLTPALRDSRQWKKEQMIDFESGNMYYLALAGKGLGRREYIQLYRDKRDGRGAWQALVDLAIGLK